MSVYGGITSEGNIVRDPDFWEWALGHGQGTISRVRPLGSLERRGDMFPTPSLSLFHFLFSLFKNSSWKMWGQKLPIPLFLLFMSVWASLRTSP